MAETLTLNQEQLWDQITNDFREACLLRREGKPQEADYILNYDLPQQIADWAKVNPEKPEEKKAELTAMFQEEQKRVDSAVAIQRIVSGRLSQELVPGLCASVTKEVRGALGEEVKRLRSAIAEAALLASVQRMMTAPRRERVKIDDIPAVLDSILAEQQLDYGPKPVADFTV
jgi:hypothetical protein